MKRVSAAEVDLEVRIPVERPHTTRMGRVRIVAVSLRKTARPSNSFIRPGPREEKLRASDFVERVSGLRDDARSFDVCGVLTANTAELSGCV